MDWIIKKFDELSASEVYEILKSRSEVFVKEQHICCIDPDGIDYESTHIFCVKNERVAAYLRAYQYDESTVKIGRVLTLVHRTGLGSELMKTAVREIPKIMPCVKIYVAAQKQAVPFYEKCGFTVTSEEYPEEGIPHHDMILKL